MLIFMFDNSISIGLIVFNAFVDFWEYQWFTFMLTMIFLFLIADVLLGILTLASHSLLWQIEILRIAFFNN